MATTYHNALQQLYVAYFNRPADPAGLAFYEGVLESGATTIDAISASFAASAEYKAEYDQLTNTGVVTQVYQNLFGKAPDAPGLAFWVNALSTGATTVGKMVTDIAAGAQNADKVAFESKVVVATAFTNAVNTEAEITAYNTEEAQAAAKALLSTIKTATQATAAIEPAALDAHVAAVVKAGTPFTLQSGLAALNAATEARAEFLEDFDTDVDGDDDVDADDIAANVDEAQTALETLVDDLQFADDDTSVGVKAAILADKQEELADTLVAEQKELTTARAAVEKVTGLATLIAESVSATEAREEADAAAVEAASTFAGAALTLETRYAASNLQVTEATGAVTATVSGAPKALTTINENGTIKVASGIDATKYVGLTALVTAFNASLAADADASEAADAELFAQLAVELRDVSVTADAADEDGASTLADIPFTSGEVTVKTAGKPTFAEIMDELSALNANEGDVAGFMAAINTFLDTNTSPLASAVAAEEEDVADAETAIDDLAEAIADLEEAQALADELESLDDAIVAAEAEFGTNDLKVPVTVDANRFGTSGSDIFVADTDTAAATITSFGRAGDDVLYIGSGFKLNASDDLDDGVNADLEVFFTQDGNNTIVTIETKAYGSESGDVIEITLTGVDADDLTFADGIISI